MDKKLLVNAISKNAICRACRNPKAQLSLLLLSCSHCPTSTPLETSEKLSGSKRADKKRGKTTYEINCRSVVGRAGLERFRGILSLPNSVSKSAYNKQLKNLEEMAFLASNLSHSQVLAIFLYCCCQGRVALVQSIDAYFDGGLKGTFVKRLLMSKEHVKIVSFLMFKFYMNLVNVKESIL